MSDNLATCWTVSWEVHYRYQKAHLTGCRSLRLRLQTHAFVLLIAAVGHRIIATAQREVFKTRIYTILSDESC